MGDDLDVPRYTPVAGRWRILSYEDGYALYGKQGRMRLTCNASVRHFIYMDDE